MALTYDEIRAIAAWEPSQAGFGRHEPQTAFRIKAIVDRIKSSGDLGCEVLEDDGLSNYFVLFAFAIPAASSEALFRRVEGLLFYLSACGPVGVVGRSGEYPGADFAAHGWLQIETLISPGQPEGRLEEKAFEAINSGGYELLSPAEVSGSIPEGVELHDASLCQGDRVFHALFGITD